MTDFTLSELPIPIIILQSTELFTLLRGEFSERVEQNGETVLEWTVPPISSD